VDEALARCDARDERWYQAELLRIKGELLLHESEHWSVAVAEQYFGKSAELAQSQGALFWELRSAMCLARVRMEQDRRAEARKILARAYDKFTEGFETADLRAASALLAELPS
jgi:predicted ATPase